MIDALQLRDNAKAELLQIKDLESGIDYLNKVKAIETWARAEKKDAELQNMIAEQKIRTQRILGIELTTSRMVNAAKDYEHEKKKADALISPRDKQLIERLNKGETIAVNQKTDIATIRYAESKNLYVRADRFSDWGNPFEMPKDGDRDEVCNNYEEHYLPLKPSLLKNISNLKGKALGCWCAPERCHCDSLKQLADEK